MIRRILLFGLIGSALFGIGLWRLSDGFSLAKMSAPLPFDSRWEVPSSSPHQVRQILSQPFTYIGKGSQAYVFESEDRQYVLKFFRLSRYRLPAFHEALPFPPFLAQIRSVKRAQKQKKLDNLFESCVLAYTSLKEECGLVYLHLNRTTHLTQQVTLRDNLKLPFAIPIDQYAFMIQRKGELVYPHLDKLIRQGKRDEAKNALLSLSTLLDKQIAKGIANSDTELYKNAGFLNGKAIIFDIGNFRQDVDRDERGKAMRKLLIWLEQKDPQLAKEAKIFLAPAPLKAF